MIINILERYCNNKILWESVYARNTIKKEILSRVNCDELCVRVAV